MSQLQGEPIDKMLSILLLACIVCLLAIGLDRQQANKSGANTGGGFGACGVDAARIGFVRVNDDMNFRPQLEARTPIEKRFVFQGPGNEELSLEDISGIDVNFNSNSNSNNNNNKRTKSSRDGNSDTDDENNDDDDDDDADSDDEDNDRNKNKNNNDNSRTPTSNSIAKPDRQQQGADVQGANGVKDQLVALANANGTTTKLTGAGVASGPGVSVANTKPDGSQRPRLFKMGLLIG